MEKTQANNNKLPSNIPQLQNLIKRDAASYTEEFERQHSVYKAICVIFEQNPTIYIEDLYQMVMFLAQIAHCYPDRLKDFPQDLVTLLKRHCSVLHPDMRMAFVKALVLLRNKNMISPIDLHMLFFQLLHCQDKNLRQFLKENIVTDIKNINSKGKNMKLNKELQNFMYEMLTSKHAVAAKTSLDVMVELYNKHVWNDAKTVNILASACFSKVTKIMVAAIKFFIGKDNEEAEETDSDCESENENNVLKSTMMALKVSKKTKKKQRKLEKAKYIAQKNQKKKKAKASFDFSALHLIHDPQDLAEKLYKRLEKMNERFEVKLMTMNMISRLIGVHQLYLPNFYPLVQRFLFPHQREVTKVMVFAAQAAHNQVPPDDLEPVVRTLANNFVTERYSSEVMAMGLNAIRELCARNPYCMSDDLLQDLTQYKTYKNKGVMMAARSLLSLFRGKNPELLAKKDRGAPSELRMEKKVEQFGENSAVSYIPGAEILTFKTQGDDEGIGLGDTDSDDEWVDVSHSDNEMDTEEENNKAVNKSTDGNKEEEKVFSTKDALKEVMKLTAKERAARAADVVSSRFLSDADFAKIAAVQAAKEVEMFSNSRKNKKRKRAVENKAESGELVSLKSIEMIYKKRKHNKDARMETIMGGREGRDKFGAKRGRMNPNASTTNREKFKTKSFMMVKYKVAGKQKRSFREKQIRLRNSLLKQKKNY
nr:protein SDA1 homolog [Cherax quadricarinatus]XP_053653013.1 protein SDA1 homolog [Cherax quadricarinatus]XP_053653014.1 protein SDA1 homolog [Cherax quadricarinatus]XP_053653016.1 protein SDA1 homolog [Cherax quadricarinatus]